MILAAAFQITYIAITLVASTELLIPQSIPTRWLEARGCVLDRPNKLNSQQCCLILITHANTSIFLLQFSN